MNNRVYEEARRLRVAVEAGSVAGSPVIWGQKGGVALTTRDAVTGEADVDFKGGFILPVTGAVTAGDAIYYAANANPAQRLSNNAAGIFYGYAIETNANPGAKLMEVKLGESSGISTVGGGSLNGAQAANVADANQVGGLPVLFRIAIAGGKAGNTDVVSTHKVRVVDVWAVHTGGDGEANDTIQVLSVAGGAITDAMDWSGLDTTIVRAGQLNDANHEVAALDSFRITTTDADAGDDVGAGIVYILAVRVA